MDPVYWLAPIFASLPSVNGAPSSFQLLRRQPLLDSHGKRQSSDSPNGGFQPSIYIPIIAFVSLGLVIFVGSVVRFKLRRAHLSQVYSRTSQHGPAVQVTAAQLTTTAQTSNGESRQTTEETPARPRRPRRNRRRPSQASVTSLPLYKEEAGDTELVLVRGQRDMHDPMQDHDDTEHEESEDEGDEPEPEERSTARQSYSSGESAHEGRDPSVPLIPHGRTQSTSTAASSIAVTVSENRGDAPPYSEIPLESLTGGFRQVDASSENLLPPSTVTPDLPPTSPHPPNTAPSNPPGSPTRKPMPSLRNLFHRNPNSGSRTIAPSSSRTHLLTHERSVSTFSNSSSLHLTPTISRLSSNHHNASSSTVSLASISAPLQHTLTRTEINYPKTGPTEAQMKLLGSRESLGRFGIPFGSVAVAYASQEPPPFLPGEVNGGFGASPSNDRREATDATLVPQSTAPPAGSEEVAHEVILETVEHLQDSNGDTAHSDLDLSPSRPVAPSDSSSSSFVTAESSITDNIGTPGGQLPIPATQEPPPGPMTPPPTPPRTGVSVAQVSTAEVGVV